MAKFLGLVVGLALFVTLPFFVFGEQIEQAFSGDGIISWLRSYGDIAWLAAVGLLVADLALPVPTTAVMAAMGIIYGPLLGGLIASMGSVVSGLVGYGLCRNFGRPLALWLSGEKGLEEGEKIFAHIGGWIVALSRWLPVISEIVACMAGLSKMSFGIFLAALICGSLPLGFLFSSIGYWGEESPGITLFLSALLPFLLWLFIRPFLLKRRFK